MDQTADIRISISILTPNHSKYSGTWGELILLSHAFPALPDHLDEDDVERLMQNHTHEWAAILVQRKPDGLKAFLWRSLTSSFDIYYFIKDSILYLSDSFIGCAVHVPKAARQPSQDAIIDHFLFRTTFGENTYFRDVHRVGHGMRVTIEPATGTVDKQQTAKLSCCPQGQSEEGYLRMIDSAIETALSEFRGKEHALLFSGGVDSTLLATYLTDNPLVTNRLTAPEFEGELVYASNAARLLGKEIQINDLPVEDYLQRLEETVDRLGMPPHHAQSVVLSSAFKAEHRKFIVGQFADGIFGICPSNEAYFGPILAKPLFAQILRPLSLLPNRKLRHAWESASAFRVPPTLPGSYAFGFACPAKLSNMERIFSRDEVERRLIARYEYISHFIDFAVHDAGKDAHLELGHQIDYFCDDTISVWRQLASAYGKTLYAPFVNPIVFNAGMLIPASARYMKGRVVKYLLKELLSRRLPSYPVIQRKRGGSVPIQRFAVQGPLVGWAEQYPPPDFVDDATLKLMHESDRGGYWHTILFAVWRARVADLTATPQPVLSIQL